MNSKETTFTKLRSRLALTMSGGNWVLELPGRDRRNLVWFWFDGIFAAASDVFPLNYLSLLLIAIGGTGEQVGAFTALTSLSAALFLMPGALLEERLGNRKLITIISGGYLARAALLAIAILPFFFSGQTLIWAFITVSVIRVAVANLAFPPWISLVNDIVPLHGRGRYFGSRNTAMTLAVILVTWLVGFSVSNLDGISGYQWMIVLSIVFGLLSIFSFSHIEDPKPSASREQIADFSLRGVWQDLRKNPHFFSFTLIFAAWNFVLFFSAPFFNVYMVEDLRFDATSIGYVLISGSVFKMLTQKKAGEWADRFGEGRILTIMMFLIPSVPILWMLSSTLWQVIIINGIAGFLWGVFELTSFNYLLHITPNIGRSRFSAVYQIIITLAASAGAAVGTLIYNQWGIPGAFLSSGFGRLATAIAFMLLTRSVDQALRHKKSDPVGQDADPQNQ